MPPRLRPLLALAASAALGCGAPETGAPVAPPAPPGTVGHSAAIIGVQPPRPGAPAGTMGPCAPGTPSCTPATRSLEQCRADLPTLVFCGWKFDSCEPEGRCEPIIHTEYLGPDPAGPFPVVRTVVKPNFQNPSDPNSPVLTRFLKDDHGKEPVLALNGPAAACTVYIDTALAGALPPEVPPDLAVGLTRMSKVDAYFCRGR